ncbi:MAG: APC family permease [Vampirovibrionales bacterium]|nr:APC family permease [Vampirovibrionales bacterium]
MSLESIVAGIKRVFLGTPIASTRERHERLTIPIALAVFASDALSSTAYATEEILMAFSATLYAGFGPLLALPIAAAICLLMAIVVISYRQVIYAYPSGGGSYEVAKEQLGPFQSQLAGSALLIDYVLTVSVSVAAGVAALTSTGIVPESSKTLLALLFIAAMTLINLRGVKESGRVLAVPAYLFMFAMVTLILTGAWKLMAADSALFTLEGLQERIQALEAFRGISGKGNLHASHDALSMWMHVGNKTTQLALVLALLNAFAHGCAALTGIEAISNGVKAFKEPAAVNANRTMVLMGLILASLFVGVTALAYGYQIAPSESQTVISQIARNVFGDGSFGYFGLQAITMVILVLAANTSFSGFPRLASILAQDGYLPRQLLNRGDRLVFSNGIVMLGVSSGLLVYLFNADTHALIPMYAIGVFLSFTLAQAGMVRHHLRNHKTGWLGGLLVNLVGAVVTALVTLLLTVEKFSEGGWIVLVAIPAIIIVFRLISRHYVALRRQLTLPETGYCPLPVKNRVLVLVSSLSRGTIPALEYAKSIASGSGNSVEAVHVELFAPATERLKEAWDEWGCGIPLTILKSPFRSLSLPLLEYIDEVSAALKLSDGSGFVTIVIPEFVTKRFWHAFLHNQTSFLIKTLLRLRKGKVVTTVRFFLDE